MNENVKNSPKSMDLCLSSYDYDLPNELIAQRPVYPRDESRLLVYDQESDSIFHDQFKNLPNYLDPNDHLVFNDSKVFPCRLFAKKTSGGKVEVFFLEKPNKEKPCEALVKASGKRKVGEKFLLENDSTLEVTEVLDGKVKLQISPAAFEIIQKEAMIPIPPYIRDGISDGKDIEDYQTIFANDNEEGSVAAPTAGLHFTDTLLSDLAENRIKRSFVTLNVGLGTFAPVKTEDLRHHKMHQESFGVRDYEWKKIKPDFGNLIAVGTTSLRVLETIDSPDNFQSNELFQTEIFLHPGVKVRSIKGLITNFHLPKSTLLMLVSALIGREKTLELYNIAVKESYRFFSYGDGMFIRLKK